MALWLAQLGRVAKSASLSATVNAGNRCADRRFPRSRPTVGQKVCVQSARWYAFLRGVMRTSGAVLLIALGSLVPALAPLSTYMSSCNTTSGLLVTQTTHPMLNA